MCKFVAAKTALMRMITENCQAEFMLPNAHKQLTNSSTADICEATARGNKILSLVVGLPIDFNFSVAVVVSMGPKKEVYTSGSTTQPGTQQSCRMLNRVLPQHGCTVRGIS